MKNKVTLVPSNTIPDDEIHIAVMCGPVSIAMVIKAPLETDEPMIDAAIDAAIETLSNFRETKGSE